MNRIITLLFASLITAGAQQSPASASNLQASIGIEQVSVGIDGIPRQLTVIALTITNSGDSPRSLIVGSAYNNADHWNVTANLMTRDGQIVALSRLPRSIIITGSVGIVESGIAAHGSSRVLLDARNFEQIVGNGSTNLAGIIGASGDRLQIVLHCGVDNFPGVPPNADTWKGDLISNWLLI